MHNAGPAICDSPAPAISLVYNNVLPHGRVYVSAPATKRLGSQNHVIESAQSHSNTVPVIEVVPGGHLAIGSDRRSAPVIQVLFEGSGALDRRLVDLLVLIRVVGMAIAGNAAFEAAIHDGAELADVVLDQRARGPAVN